MDAPVAKRGETSLVDAPVERPRKDDDQKLEKTKVEEKEPETEKKEPPSQEKGQRPTVDHWIPCPDCGVCMRPRQNRAHGGWFFGCANYPQCRGTRTYAEGQAMAAAARPERP